MLICRIQEHRSIICDNTIHTIYDVYAGDDPRDYAMRGYRPMSYRASFRTRTEAEAYIVKINRGTDQ